MRAIQEPFGNAVHACQATDLRGKPVVVIGCGTIGLFVILIARAMGASMVIGVEVDPHHAELAKQLGCDAVLTPNPLSSDAPYASDPELVKQILDLTDGLGVDVAFEMVGHNAALNNAVKSVRRGGHVVMFGVRNGNVIIEDYHRVVMNGLHMHGVVGRRIFDTWETTRALLENQDNGIQEAIYNIILAGGTEPIVHIDDWNKDEFEKVIQKFPKPIIQFD